MATRINVAVEPRHYTITIANGLLASTDVLAKECSPTETLIVTNATIAPLWLPSCLAALKGHTVETLILPDGESHKTLSTFQHIIDRLLTLRYSRKATLVALGGGVIGDLVGFAASCYLRGITFIQVPTSLLAQVDSSVGGKTGVNHALGKNMIGSFYQPRAVVIDVKTLQTLPDREYRSGLAEVLKYALIKDAIFLDWLEANIEAILAKDPQVLEAMIARCCQLKADIVASDEREQTDLRALLNFGHTLGHALENVLGYGTLLHGEAVAIGMVWALQQSVRLVGLSETAVARVITWLQAVHLPVQIPSCDREPLWQALLHDKKTAAGQLRLVVLEAIGSARVINIADKEALCKTIKPQR